MADRLDRLRRFLRELKRRNVYRVAATYAVVGFVLIQVADLTFVRLGLPPWTVTLLIVLVAMGFPLALVLAWAFEMSPEGVRRTVEVEEARGAEDRPEEERRTQSRLAMKALVGLGLVGAAVAGGWYLMGGGGESPEVTEGTVAVLPFQVSGAGAEEWRDGMVSLLSTGLDGAGGVRAIADRTVFSAWESAGVSAGAASTEEALSVARELGAEHVVLGSAAALGGELQLSAAVHATRSGERLDQVEVQGSPDSVSALTRELTRQVIAVLAAETGEELRSVELASVLTESVDALKLYVSGLQHERATESEAAIDDYEAAIRADSTFALPYARLAFLGIWIEQARGDALRRAHELADRLPERERRLVRALYLGRMEHRTLAAADSLRRLTRDYPDDPSVWQTLGEFVLHARIPGGGPEGEEAFRRAVELDPENTSLYSHFVGAAFGLHHDSALAARRIEEMPGGKQKRLYRLALKAVFGTTEIRQRALAAYDTVSVPEPWMALGPLEAPEDVELYDQVGRRLLERDDFGPDDVDFDLLFNDLERGRPDQFLRDVRRWEPEEGLMACFLAHAAVNGVPMPDSLTRRYLAPDELPADASLQRLWCAAIYGIERARMDAVNLFIERLEGDGTEATTIPAPEREARVQELDGVRAWKEGDLERAARLLSRSNESYVWGALWRGDLYRQLGELETAEGWYRVWQTPVVAYERLGGLYEKMGEPQKAAAAYRRFIAAWENADEALQPRVEAARKRVRQLTGSEDESDG